MIIDSVVHFIAGFLVAISLMNEKWSNYLLGAVVCSLVIWWLI